MFHFKYEVMNWRRSNISTAAHCSVVSKNTRGKIELYYTHYTPLSSHIKRPTEQNDQGREGIGDHPGLVCVTAFLLLTRNLLSAWFLSNRTCT